MITPSWIAAAIFCLLWLHARWEVRILRERLHAAKSTPIEHAHRYALFTGVDNLALEASILGIDGWVAGSGIAFPDENQRLWELTRCGEWDQARALYRWFQPLLKLDTHVHFVQYIKLCEQEVGLGAEWVRAPRLPIAGAERKAVLKIIRDAIAQRPKLAKLNLRN